MKLERCLVALGALTLSVFGCGDEVAPADLDLQARVHELRGVYRRHHRHGDGEEQSVKRAFQRPKGQRHQTELGLEVIAAAGGLPSVFRLIVTLVPDLAEQRRE